MSQWSAVNGYLWSGEVTTHLEHRPRAVKPIRVLIVDDEPLARERMRNLLEAHPDVEVIGEAVDGAEAVKAIREQTPELVFLDIQMPEVDAFGVIKEIGVEEMPSVVFATSYDAFALRAFEANAVDYLLKPVGNERLDATLQRIRARREDNSAQGLRSEFLKWLEEHRLPQPQYKERFAVRGGTGFDVVPSKEILWIEAADNYVRLHTRKAARLYRSTLAELHAVLDPRQFVRVHRSAIVNVNAVQSIQPWAIGEFLFLLTNGAKVSSSRRYRRDIREAFGC